MGEYDGFKPQDDLGHSIDDYQPGMGAMVAMGYEGGPEFEGAEAFDMGHTWSPGTMPGMPHGPFDEPDKMGWEHEYRRQEHGRRRGFWARLFGDRFGDDDTDASIYPGSQDDVTEDYVTEEHVPVATYGYGFRPRHAPGWAAWQQPLPPMSRTAFRRR
jgi:hypothetical protein